MRIAERAVGHERIIEVLRVIRIMFEGVELRQFDLETGSHKLQSGEKYGG